MELLLALQSGSELTVDKGGLEVGAVERGFAVAFDDQLHTCSHRCMTEQQLVQPACKPAKQRCLEEGGPGQVYKFV